MTDSEILSNLKIDMSINSRKLAKNIILDSNISAEKILDHIENSDERTQILFCCVLDLIIDEHTDYLNNCLSRFIELQKKFTNETCKRTSSRIFYHILMKNPSQFTKNQKDTLVNTHFDWLISNSFVATRVNCLSVLFELRNEAEWITSELLAIIDRQVQSKEPSFVSRAKKILSKISKEEKHQKP
nr:hypothetical protein [uncultured Flavobacterium sp.]